MTYPAWSEAEDAYLRDALALGTTQMEIAKDLGRTIGAVISRRNRLGIYQSPMNSEIGRRREDPTQGAARGCARLLRAQLRTGQHSLQSVEAIQAAWESVEGIAA